MSIITLKGFDTYDVFIGQQLFTILPNATSYEFTVHVTNGLGYTGKSHVLIEPNRPPSDGSCSITGPGNAIFAGTALKVKCIDWVDSDGIDSRNYFGKVILHR